MVELAAQLPASIPTGQDPEENPKDLHARVHRGGCRLPARRLSRKAYIPAAAREPLRRSRASSTALCGAQLVELERDTNPPQPVCPARTTSAASPRGRSVSNAGLIEHVPQQPRAFVRIAGRHRMRAAGATTALSPSLNLRLTVRPTPKQSNPARRPASDIRRVLVVDAMDDQASAFSRRFDSRPRLHDRCLWRRLADVARTRGE
jgi:hypothetical protein